MSRERTAYYVLGAGRVGATLAAILEKRGCLAGCWTRSAATAAQLSDRLSVDVAYGSLPSVDDSTAVIIVAVPDRVVARLLGAHPDREQQRRRWLHVSGSLGTSVFVKTGVAGATGVAHPLHSFAGDLTRVDLASGDELAGAVMTLTGDVSALEAGRDLAKELRCEPVEIAEEQGAAYHLAATLSSNGVYALLHAAESVLTSAGVHDEQLLSGMARLASQSAESARRSDAAKAATGPVVRGDANTVRAHRRVLSDQRSEVSALYDQLALVLLEIAEKRGLSARLHAAVSAVLVERPS